MFFTLLLYVVLNSFPVRGSNRRPLGGCRVFFIRLAFQDQGRFFSNGSFFQKKCTILALKREKHYNANVQWFFMFLAAAFIKDN